MAGLLDFNDPQTRMGLGLLALGQAPRSQFAQGLAGLLAQESQAKQQEMQRQVMQSQIDENKAQAQAKMAQQEALLRKQQALPSLFTAGAQDGQSAAPGAPSQAALDWQRALQAGYSPDEIQKLAALQNLGRQKVVRTVEGVDEQGRPVTYQVDEFGQRVGAGIGQWKAPMVINQGDRQTLLDPATRQTLGSLGVNMSQAERDASARGWAGQNLARERFAMEQQQGGKPTFNAEAGGFIVPPSQNNPQGGIIPLQGFQKPLNDVQAKAQLFGTRMQEADKILSDLQKGGKSFSTPGANAPLIGGLVNAVNTEQGQMLDQAKRDFTNAVLRRESGAAIAKSEFDSADKQYFPQIGDSEKVIAQKARARQIAIQGILSEVPKGAPPIRVDGGQSGGATGGWNGGPVPKTPMKGQVIGGFRYKGGDPADQSNWEKQ